MSFKKSVLQCTSIALLTALLCGLVFICPVFAVDSLSLIPIWSGASNPTKDEIISSGISLWSPSDWSSSSRNFIISSGNDLTAFYFIDSNVASFIICSLTSASSQYYYARSGYSGIGEGAINTTYSGFSGIFYNLISVNTSGIIEYNVPSFDSLESGLSAAYEFLTTGGSSSGDLITASSYFGVPAGYAAYIEIPSNSTDWDITVSQEFDAYSSLFGGQWSPMTSLWGFQSSLPSGSGNFSKTGLTVIPMYKMKPYTVLGQSKTGFSNKSTMVANGFWSDTPSAKYLVIYNPVIRAVSGTVGGASIADNVYVYNKGISVTMSGFYSPVKYYKLESTVTTSGLDSSPAVGTFEDSEYTETFDSDGNSEGIVNSSGDSSTLSDGGGDLIPSATSIGDYVRNLNQTLNNFASNFIDLMTSPISHVQQLINAGSNYFNVIQGLYGWLPDEVHAVVKSGMVVALSIGVISVLL